MSRLFVGAALAAGILASSPVLAHHGWGGYETTAQKMSGVVTAVDYSNPHANVRLKSGNKDYLIVLAPPSRMTNRGLPDGALKVGQSVSIEGYVSKSDPSELRAERITVNTQTVELR